jgi:hypothetical protein
MALTYEISTQEYRLLDLIASKEENPRAPDVYMSLWPSNFDPRLPSMTLAQVDEFQQSRIRTAGGSAAGRYQFIRKTLNGLVSDNRLPRNLIFNNVLQDFLALQLLLGRQLRRWQSGSISDAQFQLNLAKEWAAIPVPFDTQGHKRRVVKGESYYAGDGLNSAGINADVMFRELRSLRLRGPVETFTLDLATSSRSHPITGDTAWSQAQIAAGGGQTVYGGSSRQLRSTYTGGLVADSLPPVDNPYQWDQIHLLDNRYDFRSGKKVRDLLYNGYQPAAAGAYQDNNGRPPAVDIGDNPEGVAEVAAAVQPTAGPDDGLRGTPSLPSFEVMGLAPTPEQIAAQRARDAFIGPQLPPAFTLDDVR